MLDGRGREINYLRISVTDRCNLRCRYCMPEEGVNYLGHDKILSLEDIARLVRISTSIGIHKVRLTGGSPLVRRNICQLIRYIRDIPEIDDIALSTNGILYADMADDLKAAGLNRINFSLDTLVPEKYTYITRRGQLPDVIRALNKAIILHMDPIKINAVVIRGFNDDEILDFAALAYTHPLHIRFIEFMPIGDMFFWQKERMIHSDEIKNIISQHYTLEENKITTGNGPAKSYKVSGGKGSLGFISPMSNHFCGECNRIRLTAEGKLRACLYDKKEIDLKPALENGANDEEIRQLFIKTIHAKPDKHHMNNGWGENNQRKMYQIGG